MAGQNEPAARALALESPNRQKPLSQRDLAERDSDMRVISTKPGKASAKQAAMVAMGTRGAEGSAACQSQTQRPTGRAIDARRSDL
jgi:hypothetical protein